MIYRIKEKSWRWTDTYEITDEAENPVFRVKGKAFSWGDKLSFQDLSENELAHIDQKLISFKPRYKIHVHGRFLAEMVQETPRWFENIYTLDIPGPNDYRIEGSFLSLEFSFMRQEEEVARVSKEMWSWSDSYGVQIVDGEDDVLILCACIVINQILDDQKNYP